MTAPSPLKSLSEEATSPGRMNKLSSPSSCSSPSSPSPSSSSSSSSSCHVRVVARIRPLSKVEKSNDCQPIVHSLQSTKRTTTTVPTNRNKCTSVKPSEEPEVLEVRPVLGSTEEKRWFELDGVLDSSSTQEEVYVKSGAQQAVRVDIFKGFNCTILAYGQTGAGKTFTMGTALPDENQNNNQQQKQPTTMPSTAGVIPRACADLFEEIQMKCDGNAQVELSYMEIYNEEIRDLLVLDNENTNSNTKQQRNALKIRETLAGEVYVSGLQSRVVQSSNEIGQYMYEGSKRRIVASTQMNSVSSRSHAICVLKIKGMMTGEHENDCVKFQAKLTLVDLAGSERLKKTLAQGSRKKEGININKGLFVLGQVVSALTESRKKYKRRPPYRDSKLTRLLQDSLGGNSRTIMIACVSPADVNVSETVNTLRYATSARNIKNVATQNRIQTIHPEEAAKLQRENELLKAQVKELQDLISKMTLEAYEQSTTQSTVSISTIESMMDCWYSDDENNNTTTNGSGRSSRRNSSTSLNNIVNNNNNNNNNNSNNNNMDNAKDGNNTSNTDNNNNNNNTDDLQQQSRQQQQQQQQQPLNNNNSNTKYIKDLEKEVKRLKTALGEAKVDIRKSAAASAIQLPAYRVQMAVMEDELAHVHEIQNENEQLWQDLEEMKTDAQAAKIAAAKLSRTLEMIQESHATNSVREELNAQELSEGKGWLVFISFLIVCQLILSVILLKGQDQDRESLGTIVNMIMMTTSSSSNSDTTTTTCTTTTAAEPL